MPTVIPTSQPPDMNIERAYAAEQLKQFLEKVGPVQAFWACTTASEALQELPAGENHVAAVMAALSESVEEAPEAPGTEGEGGDPTNPEGEGEALLSETPAPEASTAEAPTAEAPAKRSGRAS